VRTDKLHQELSEWISRHRKVASLSQLELAELAGVGKTVIFDLEHGKPGVRLDTLLKVLHALNIDIELRSPLSD
jgi:y4mF family transcriptional regulator